MCNKHSEYLSTSKWWCYFQPLSVKQLQANEYMYNAAVSWCKLSMHFIIARDDTCRDMHIFASHREEEEEEERGKPNQPQQQTDQSDQQVWPLICERVNTTLGGVVSWQPLTRFILPIFRICKCHGQNKKQRKQHSFITTITGTKNHRIFKIKHCRIIK